VVAGLTDTLGVAMAEDVAGLGLREAIESIRADLLAARESGEDADIRFPVTSVTVELQVVATKAGGGKGGFKVPFVHLELGAEASRTSGNTNTVTVVLGEPVDRTGTPVKVAKTSWTPKG
jgi:hypothetical protein